MSVRCALLLISVLLVSALSISRVGAKSMFSFDLDSLIFMSKQIFEVEVKETRKTDWITVLNLSVLKNWSSESDKQVQEKSRVWQTIIGLSAYSKDSSRGEFKPGDHLFVFIEPASSNWQKQGIPFWPVPSGIKVIEQDRVKGMVQLSNPGPYEASLDQGCLSDFKDELRISMKKMKVFAAEFARNRSNANWLLRELEARPIREGDTSRDQIAIVLCQALAKTADTRAIDEAKRKRHNFYEKQLLSQ